MRGGQDFLGTKKLIIRNKIKGLGARDVIRRLCNKDRDQGQKGIGVRYRSCSDIQYKG